MKTCKANNCEHNVFSNGYCGMHQYLRTDSKKPKPLKRSYVSKVKTPVKRKSPLKRSYKPTGELKVFMEIYEDNKSNWVSKLSGIALGHKDHYLFINQFAHLLNKKKYPKYRLRKENILPLTPHEHQLLDFGTQKQRKDYAETVECDWDIVYDKIEQLKKLYNG